LTGKITYTEKNEKADFSSWQVWESKKDKSYTSGHMQHSLLRHTRPNTWMTDEEFYTSDRIKPMFPNSIRYLKALNK